MLAAEVLLYAGFGMMIVAGILIPIRRFTVTAVTVALGIGSSLMLAGLIVSSL
ncbi:MAG TPA: hypothetical protein VLF88_02955 [Candidatus Babeliales bacterium]|nr:hypothetical protein [Candidatus Babeliales bacterium]